MFCKIFLTFNLNVRIFYIILSIPHNTVMALNYVMNLVEINPYYSMRSRGHQ